MHLLSAASIVFFINLPFGYWRANTKKFSRGWFLSVHAPVPLVVAVRMLSGLGFHLITFPVMIGAFFGGQFAGSRLHRALSEHYDSRVSSCLVWDLVGARKRSAKA